MDVHREQQLPITLPTLERRYGLMAEILDFATNDPHLLEAADASFGRFAVPSDDRPPLVVRLYSEASDADAGVADQPGSHVDRADETRPSAAAGIVNRMEGNLYLISGGGHDLAVADGETGIATGFVSAATARDTAAVRYSFIESMALVMLGRCRGYLTIHAAGVVRNGLGVVIQGPAGAGKSTLAMACARRGFGVFAEDVVFVRQTSSSMELWGMPWTQRLMPDVRTFFPELARFEDRRQPNGEIKIEVDLDVAQPGRSTPCAGPGPIVLLERGDGGPTRIERVDPGGHGALELLWPWDGGWTAEHDRGVAQLAAMPTYRLHMNGSPGEAVDALETMLDGLDARLPGR